MNDLKLYGRTTRDLDIRYTQGGTARAFFVLAVDKRLSRDKKAELESKGEPTADFIPITVWGKQAERLANNLFKGKRCIVDASIKNSEFEKDGQKVQRLEVVAYNVQIVDWKNDQAQGYENGDDNGFVDGWDTVDENDIPF